MRTIIAAFLVCSHALAVEPEVTWQVWIRPLPCPGHAGVSNAPTVMFSCEMWTNTWYYSTNLPSPESPFGIVYLSVPLPVGVWTLIDSGTSGVIIRDQNNRWGFINSLKYDASCCAHTNAWVGVELKDESSFNGGQIGTNETRVTYHAIQMPPKSQGHYGIVFETQHIVDDAVWREASFSIQPHGWTDLCLPQGPWVLEMSNALPRFIRSRGLTNASGVLQPGFWTNYSIPHGWTNIHNPVPFQTDSNGNFGLDVSGWQWPPEAGFIKVQVTNQPGTN